MHVIVSHLLCPTTASAESRAGEEPTVSSSVSSNESAWPPQENCVPTPMAEYGPAMAGPTGPVPAPMDKTSHLTVPFLASCIQKVLAIFLLLLRMNICTD